MFPINNTDFLAKIEEIYFLQDKLNIETIKLKNWHDGFAENGMKIDWFRYIKLETAELIESFPVKHWKDIKKEIDFLNTKVELVDILHFLFSHIIKTIKDERKDNDYAISTLIFNPFFKGFFLVEKNNILALERFEATEVFFKKAKEFEFLTAYYHLRENDTILGDDKFMYLEKILFSFCELCNLLDLDFNELHKLYIGKNCLNKFRQDNGYKEGTYKKIWNNKEDNVVMKEILYSKDFTFETLYLELKKVYEKL